MKPRCLETSLPPNLGASKPRCLETRAHGPRAPRQCRTNIFKSLHLFVEEFQDFMKTKKNCSESTSRFPVASQLDLCYVSENEETCYVRGKG